MDYQRMIEEGRQAAPQLEEIYKVKNLQPSQHSIRRWPMLIEAVIALLSGFVYIYYADNVEKGVACYSDGNFPLPIQINEEWTDVASSFQIVIMGYGVLASIDCVF